MGAVQGPQRLNPPADARPAADPTRGARAGQTTAHAPQAASRSSPSTGTLRRGDDRPPAMREVPGRDSPAVRSRRPATLAKRSGARRRGRGLIIHRPGRTVHAAPASNATADRRPRTAGAARVGDAPPPTRLAAAAATRPDCEPRHQVDAGGCRHTNPRRTPNPLPPQRLRPMDARPGRPPMAPAEGLSDRADTPPMTRWRRALARFARSL
jgi:hypothetical protein